MQFYDTLWKAELSQFLKEFVDATAQTGDEDANRFFAIERPLLYSAFIVRKLIEDNGVSDTVKGKWLEVDCHASLRNGQPVCLETLGGPLEINEHFDLTRRSVVRISYSNVASEIIHSEGLAWDTENESLSVFAVFSYRNALRQLLKIPVGKYVAMLSEVISDQPTQWHVAKDLRTGKITYHAT